MTVEEKNLLLKDLCARLPYGVMAKSIKEDDESIAKCVCIHMNQEAIYTYQEISGGKITTLIPIEEVKPFLRPMESMTSDEKAEFMWLEDKCAKMPTCEYVAIGNYRIFDWLNRKHFDYRGLIEKGIALEAPVDMYDDIKVL